MRHSDRSCGRLIREPAEPDPLFVPLGAIMDLDRSRKHLLLLRSVFRGVLADFTARPLPVTPLSAILSFVSLYMPTRISIRQLDLESFLAFYAESLHTPIPKLLGEGRPVPAALLSILCFIEAELFRIREERRRLLMIGWH